MKQTFAKPRVDLTLADIGEMVTEMQEEGLLGEEGAGKVMSFIS